MHLVCSMISVLCVLSMCIALIAHAEIKHQIMLEGEKDHVG